MKLLLLLLIGLLLLQLGTAAAARAKVSPGEPDPLSATRSIGDVIAEAKGKSVHIIYVHGMRAKGVGLAKPFLAKLAHHIGHRGALDRAERRHVDLGVWPRTARVAAGRIWESEAEWSASRPFVDRYLLQGSKGETIIVDEFNWWPLLFPLKCRFLLLPERDLAGADEAHLRLCARDDKPYYPWITRDELSEALSGKPASGGGARINRSLKHQIMNWGLSDAVIALGPMQTYIREALNQAFSFAEERREKLADPEYVVISESLGSFAVMDAFNEGKSCVASVLDKTHNLYFLANQFALLDLGRVVNLDVGHSAAPTSTFPKLEDSPPAHASPLTALQKWAEGRQSVIEDRAIRQVVAFSDPSDILTYRVPKITGALTSNVYIRNGSSFLGLIADPVKAHDNHIQNPRVIEAMLGKRGN